MKNIFLLFFLLPGWLSAQNLVSNPGFEDVNCPLRYTGFPGQIDQYVNGWRSGNCASPDIYAPCSEDSITRPPAAWYGSQRARTGTNFTAIGFYEIGPVAWYEYLVSELPQPLTAGQTYELSYWLSRADSTRYATNAMGAAFSTTLDTCLTGFEGPVLPYTSVFSGGAMITDTAGWTQITTQYTANGTERYLILGCFEPWSQLQLQDFGSGQNRCYYYIDDVSLTLSQVNGFDEKLVFQKPFPNPFNNEFHLEPAVPARLIVSDMFGKEVVRKSLRASTLYTVSLQGKAAGVYLVELHSEQGRRVYKMQRW